MIMKMLLKSLLKQKLECPLCNTTSVKFLKLPDQFNRDLVINKKIYVVDDFETINIENYLCPNCYAADRDRLYWLFINKVIKSWEVNNYSIIHFAPEQAIKNILINNKNINYRTADMKMEGVDDFIDITDMKIYKDNSFDFIICSHILEHIEDDARAIRELYRILKPDRYGILMAPVCLLFNDSYENSTKRTPEERLEYFGQEDHVRVYAKNDYIKRIENGGFKVHQFDIKYFGKKEFKKYAITEKSVLYVVEKIY